MYKVASGSNMSGDGCWCNECHSIPYLHTRHGGSRLFDIAGAFEAESKAWHLSQGYE